MKYKQWYKDLFYKKIKRPRMKRSYFNTIVDVNRIVINSGKNGITVSKIAELIGKSYRETLRIVYELAKAGFVCIIRGRRGRVVSNSDRIYQEFLNSQKNMTNATPTPPTDKIDVNIDILTNSFYSSSILKNEEADSKKNIKYPHVFLSTKKIEQKFYTILENKRTPGVYLYIKTGILTRWCEYYGYDEEDLIKCMRRFIFWTQNSLKNKIQFRTEIIGLLVKFVKNDFILNHNVDYLNTIPKSPMGVYVFQAEAEIEDFENYFTEKYKRKPLEYAVVRYGDDKTKGIVIAKGIKKWACKKYDLVEEDFKKIRRKFMEFIFETMNTIPAFFKNAFGLFVKFIHNFIKSKNYTVFDLLANHFKNEAKNKKCEVNNNEEEKEDKKIRYVNGYICVIKNKQEKKKEGGIMSLKDILQNISNRVPLLEEVVK